MAKSKLEKAIDERAGALGAAQAELVRSQYAVYRQNKARLAELKERMKLVDGANVSTLDEVRAKQATRSTLSYEYNQLAVVNSRIASDLFALLEERR